MANVERYSWNVQINGVVYLVEYMKGSVYINGGEAFKLRSLEYKRKFIPSRMSYTVPLAGKELTLVIGPDRRSCAFDGWNRYEHRTTVPGAKVAGLGRCVLCVVYYKYFCGAWRCGRCIDQCDHGNHNYDDCE